MTTDTPNLVHKITDDVDPRDVYATTYQMRNFFRQLGDGYFTGLDVFNYAQHHQVVRWAKPRTRLLDVCCGRGLLLPLLRYHRKDLGSYTGVDIHPPNAVFTQHKRVTDGKPHDADYYPFPVRFVHSDAATMQEPLAGEQFDLIVYTSAIEHMQRDVGLRTLQACRDLAAPKGRMLLTTPRTPDDKDGYDTQYAAHVYEWTRPELLEGLADTGWRVVAEWGIWAKRGDLADQFNAHGLGWLWDRLDAVIPPEFLVPALAPAFPQVAKEIAFLLEPA